MQKAILVKDGATVVEKKVYAGDVSDPTMSREVERLQALHPGKTVTLYSSDQDPEFVQA